MMTQLPSVKKRTVVLSFWDCGLVGHRHQSRTRAQECKRKRINRDAPKKEPPLERRDNAIVGARLAGYTLKEIANAIGRSNTTVKYVVDKAMRRGRVLVEQFKHTGNAPSGD